MIRGAQGAAPGVGDRAETRRAVGHHHAHVPALLALDADAVGGHVRGPARQVRPDHLQQLTPVDRAAPELEVDGDVLGDRGGRSQRGDERRRGVDDAQELLDVTEVAQGLDPPGRGARPDRDQVTGLATDLQNAFHVVRRGDRALDERDVVGPLHGRARRLEEVGDLELVGHRQQFVLAVEQRELTAVTARELPHREGGLRGAHRARTMS